MSIQQKELDLLKKFESLGNWESRYKEIIAMGKELAPFPEDKKNDTYKVSGCQSQVWLWAEQLPNGHIKLFADSDALITKGLVALVVKLYSDEDPKEVLGHSLDIFKKLGLFDHLSPSRANGFGQMIKQVKNYALALQLTKG